MTSFSAWMEAFRLRTLPLALSSIILGSFLAAFRESFSWTVAILAGITTLFLQILSNLANDYGDTVSGVDNVGRTGPKRALQQGHITLQQMKSAIVVFIGLSLVSGIALLLSSAATLDRTVFAGMFGLGIAAIIAALKYTMGKNPYGYAGFGDLFVFVFFGLIGVMGTFYLHTGIITMHEWLPAATIGLFSTGVLNLNNARDRDNDEACGKRTLAVILGDKKIKCYHLIILTTGMLMAVIYSLTVDASGLKWIYIPAFAIIIKNIMVVIQNQNPSELDPELKRLALGTLIFSLLFGLGLVL